MLAREARLSREAVALVVARGSRYGHSALGLRFLRDQTNSRTTQFAIVVPAKQIPLAVDRHRVKRRVRAVLHTLSPRLLSSLAVVVFCGGGVKDWTQAQFGERIGELFSQAKLIK